MRESSNKQVHGTRAMPLVAAAAVPLLLFPVGPLPLVGVALFALSAVLGHYYSGTWFVQTPLDRSIIIILLMTFAALYPSVDTDLSMPKFYGIVLGFSVYYVTVTSTLSWRRFWFGVAVLIAGLVMTSLIGLVGVDWKAGKYPVMAGVYSNLPRLVTTVQASVGPTSGIHPAELAGSLSFLLPLPLALLLRARFATAWRFALLFPAGIAALVIVLSASRAGLAAMAVSAFALVIWQRRRLGLALLTLAVMALAVVLIRNAQDLAALAIRMETMSVVGQYSTMTSRMDVWSRALSLIEEFPFTGIGLNTFPVMVETFYRPYPDLLIAHAHNIFLQTAVDLGLGGLLGFLGVWAAIAHVALRAYLQAGAGVTTRDLKESNYPSRSYLADHMRAHGAGGPARQAAIAGLSVGLIGFVVFGMTDAITLGAKPMVFLWLLMGLIVAAQRLTEARTSDGIEETGAGPASMDFCALLHKVLPSRLAVWFAPGRMLAQVARAAVQAYWAIAYLLVALGYLLVGLGLLAWRP